MIKLRMATKWRTSELRKWKRPFAQISNCKGKTLKTNGAMKRAALRNAFITSFLKKSHYTGDNNTPDLSKEVGNMNAY